MFCVHLRATQARDRGRCISSSLNQDCSLQDAAVLVPTTSLKCFLLGLSLRSRSLAHLKLLWETYAWVDLALGASAFNCSTIRCLRRHASPFLSEPPSRSGRWSVCSLHPAPSPPVPAMASRVDNGSRKAWTPVSGAGYLPMMAVRSPSMPRSCLCGPRQCQWKS